MTTKTTQRLTLDDIRDVFPNVRIAPKADDLPLALKRLPRKCIICGFIYNGWPESEYCGNGCAVVGHQRHENSSKGRIKSLREQCRLSWQRATERVTPQSFEEWLYHFGMFLEWMREQAKPNNQGDHENANDISER